MKKYFTVNAQTLGRTHDMRGCYAIAKKIAAPFQVECRFDFHAYLFDAYVVTFARSNHQAMGTKTDSFLIKIGRIVNDVQPAHRSRLVEFASRFRLLSPVDPTESLRRSD
jgi:hypothetical protein